MNAQKSKLFPISCHCMIRFAVILICVTSIGFAQSNRKRATDDAESAAVYAAAIEEAFSDSIMAKSPGYVFVISNMAFADTPAYSKNDKYDSETIASFMKLKRPAKLENELMLPWKVPYAIMDEEGLQSANDEDRYNAYRARRFGGGLIRLSHIGFNRSRTKAFLYIEFAYCPLCEFGEYMLLEKDNEVWKVKERQSSWKS